MRFPLVFLPFLLAACSNEETTSPSSPEPDAADTSVTGCDYECFPGATCMGGVVTVSTGGQRTCGMCEFTTYTCKKRCRYDDAGLIGVFAGELLCEESRPKRVGDPCEVQEDCTPVAADDAGGISSALYCDAGSCSPAADAGADGD